MAAKPGEEQHQPLSDIDSDCGNAADNVEAETQKGDNPATGDGGLAPCVFSREEAMRLAIYIAMAQGGLALSFALVYGLSRLLQDYRRPIQWALLCSMPLRELHTALVSFWFHPLHLGLPEASLAVPLATLRSVTSSLIDSHAALHRLLRSRSQPRHSPAHLGFSKLMRWLVSFGFFVLLHERFGLRPPRLPRLCRSWPSRFRPQPPSPSLRHPLRHLFSPPHHLQTQALFRSPAARPLSL